MRSCYLEGCFKIFQEGDLDVTVTLRCFFKEVKLRNTTKESGFLLTSLKTKLGRSGDVKRSILFLEWPKRIFSPAEEEEVG